MFSMFKKKQDKKSDFELEDDDDAETDDGFTNSLKLNLSRLIVYAESADVKLQREVAEKLANEAVKPDRQKKIVEYGGLRLLVPLTESSDPEVQRLAAHALANLSVDAENQILMAEEGGIEMLINLLDSDHELIQRQSAKALANLGVNVENKRGIALKGGIPKLVRLSGSPQLSVRIEAIAALANLAVNDVNELEIVKEGGLEPIVEGVALAVRALSKNTSDSQRKEKDYINSEELAAQCARALRNLSVNPSNKMAIISLGAVTHLQSLTEISNDRISQQARRALRNLDSEQGAKK